MAKFRGEIVLDMLGVNARRPGSLTPAFVP
jgi:hypothetical protein